MTETGKEIIGYAGRWIQSRLSDRSTVTLPLIGQFTPVLSPDYFLQEPDGSLTLYPPSVGLSFVADPYLLEGQRYASLDFTAPDEIVPKAMVEALSGLYERDEKEVEGVLREYISGLLSNLFKGRRITLFGLGDLFVTEVSGRLLMLNFEPAPELLSAQNHPFSSYLPVRLPSSSGLPDTAVILQAPPAKEIRQFPIIEREQAKEPEEETSEEASTLIEDSQASNAPKEEPRTPANPAQKPRKRWLTYLLYFALLALLLLTLLLFLFPKETSEKAPLTVEKDTLSVQGPLPPKGGETTPALLPRDTITSGETLVKLAQKYWGEKEYWVYLYFHNRSSIKDPNNVPIGTVLEVPELSSFELPEDKAKALREAKDWAFVILNGHFTDYATQRPELPVNRQTPIQ